MQSKTKRDTKANSLKKNQEKRKKNFFFFLSTCFFYFFERKKKKKKKKRKRKEKILPGSFPCQAEPTSHHLPFSFDWRMSCKLAPIG